MEFIAEIRQIRLKKLISLDKEITITFNTGDLKVLNLGKVPADTLVKVRVNEVTKRNSNKAQDTGLSDL